MLEKQHLRMNVNPLSVQYPGVDSEIMFNSDDFTQDLNIRYEDWKDMGSPNVVTVTVEPGDKLNTPLLDLSDPLTPNEIKDMYK